MNILVAVKRVVDYHVKIRVRADGSGVDTHQVKMSLNPFDEIALEEAIRLKEAGVAKQVIACLIGPTAHQESLRQALALGADRALLIDTDQTNDPSLPPLAIAKVLAKVVRDEQIDLALLGKQSIDGDHNQTGQMLAGLLSWSQGTFVSKVTILDEQRLSVIREVDGGLQSLMLTRPAVLTTDLRLNQPRYASLPNIMKAKHKPLDTVALARYLPSEADQQIIKQIQIVSVAEPPPATGGITVDDVPSLIEHLEQVGALS